MFWKLATHFLDHTTWILAPPLTPMSLLVNNTYTMHIVYKTALNKN